MLRGQDCWAVVDAYVACAALVEAAGGGGGGVVDWGLRFEDCGVEFAVHYVLVDVVLGGVVVVGLWVRG